MLQLTRNKINPNWQWLARRPEDVERPALRLAAAGRDTGLGVVVHQDSTDFAYVRRPTIGLEVKI